MQDVKELERQQREMEEEHEKSELFEYEIAGIKGQGMPYDALWGTDPADIRARRHARGQFAPEDFESPSPNPVDDYIGPRTGAEVTNRDELSSYVEYKVNMARETHPDFDEVVGTYVLPKLRGEFGQPEIENWFLRESNFAEKAYAIGKREQKRLRNQLPSAEEIDKLTAQQFTEILDRYRIGGADGEEKESDEFISRREMKRMNGIANPVDFGMALDAIKWRGR